MEIITLGDVPKEKLKGQKVLVRCDFNIPIDKATGQITDNTRIVEALPTIQELIENECKIVLVSHFQKLKEKFDSKDSPLESKVDPKLSLEPIAKELARLLGQEVIFARDTIGEDAKAKCEALNRGEVVLLENVRFYKGETSKQHEDRIAFAKELKKTTGADIFVMDGFGASHREHASTAEIATMMVPIEGKLMQKEHHGLEPVLSENPERPFIAVLGGAKVSDKIDVIRVLLKKADKIIIGGKMANVFLLVEKDEKGEPKIKNEAARTVLGEDVSERDKEFAIECLEIARKTGKQIILPQDVVIARKEDIEKKKKDKTFAIRETKCVSVNEIEAGFLAADIGNNTSETIKDALQGAKTVMWNGPLGIFEMPELANGTIQTAQALVELDDAKVVIGGGDSVSAVKTALEGQKIPQHIYLSTGGGATLDTIKLGWNNLPAVKYMRKTVKMIIEFRNAIKNKGIVQENISCPKKDEGR